MKQNWLVTILIAVVVGGLAFFGGMQYQKSQVPSFGQGRGQFYARFGQNGQNIRPTRGQVISADSTSLTVKLPDGTSKIVVVGASTAFVKSDTASQSDIKTGDTVMVLGSQNSDGSVTAQQVQINPPMMGRGQGPNMSPTGTQ